MKVLTPTQNVKMYGLAPRPNYLKNLWFLNFILLSGLCSSCATVGDVFVPTHPNSSAKIPAGSLTLTIDDVLPPALPSSDSDGDLKVKDPLKTLIATLSKKDREKLHTVQSELSTMMTGLIESGLELVADQVGKVIIKEAAKYEASYSARHSQVVPITFYPYEDAGERFHTMVVTGSNEVITFKINLHLNLRDGLFYASLNEVTVEKFKSKVLSTGGRCTFLAFWRWPVGIGVLGSRLFGYDDPFEKEMNIRLQVESLYKSELKKIAIIDFPIGKVDVKNLPSQLVSPTSDSDELKRKNLTSVYYPFLKAEVKDQYTDAINGIFVENLNLSATPTLQGGHFSTQTTLNLLEDVPLYENDLSDQESNTYITSQLLLHQLRSQSVTKRIPLNIIVTVMEASKFDDLLSDGASEMEKSKEDIIKELIELIK